MTAAPVGADLRAARQDAGLTIEQLAVLAGVGSATVFRIERAEVHPQRSTLRAIGAALAEHLNEKRPAGQPGASAVEADRGGRDALPA